MSLVILAGTVQAPEPTREGTVTPRDEFDGGQADTAKPTPHDCTAQQP